MTKLGTPDEERAVRLSTVRKMNSFTSGVGSVVVLVRHDLEKREIMTVHRGNKIKNYWGAFGHYFNTATNAFEEKYIDKTNCGDE